MDHHSNLSKEDLIKKINSLESLVEALKQEKDQDELLNFPWIGNLGHWHWDVQNDNLICNDWKILALNYTKDEIPNNMGFEFFTSKLHPEDYERVMDNMRQHLYRKTDVYEVEYRIKTKDGHWKWYYDRGKISKSSDTKQPLLVSGIVFDITEAKEMEMLIKEQNKKLEKLVDFDSLTKVLNRRGLLQRLESEIDIANKTKQNLSVIMIDIDKFTLVNDNHGHLVGDAILEQVASKIKLNMFGKDVVGRYGGEEFLILLSNTDKEKACIVAERIRKDIEIGKFANDIKITISCGVKEYKNESTYKLIDGADKRLYRAKENGRNQVVYD